MYKIRDYPYLAIRDRVLFPGLMYGVDFQPGAAQDAVQAAWSSESKTLAIFTTLGADEAGLDDLYPIGVLAAARELRGNSLDVEILERVRLRDISHLPHPIAQVELMEAPSQDISSSQAEELDGQLRALAARIFSASGEVGRRAATIVEDIDEDRYMTLVEVLASTLALPARDALEVLAAPGLGEAQRRLLRAQKSLWAERPAEMVRRVVWPPAGERVEEEEAEESAARLRDLIDELELAPEILDRLAPEIDRLDRFDPVLFDHQETLARLEGLLAYPWGIFGEEGPDLNRVESALHESVLGHQQAKLSLLDMLSVRCLRPDASFPLVILAGSPGLGQGTLVRALASALSRPLERIPLPTLGAESFLLGLPRGVPEGREGAIYKAALSAATMDPVLHLSSVSTLDEATARALLRLTDPITSPAFEDAFIGLPLDVSQMLVVLQVRTPEMVPESLRARALILELESYAPAQRRALLVEHLWPEALREAGLSDKAVRLQASLVEWLVMRRCREAGVAELRQLSRRLASRLARGKVTGTARLTVSLAMARECLGEAEDPVREGRAVGVVGQVALVAGGARVLESAALAGHPTTRARSEAIREIEELALSLGPANARQARRSWHLVAPQGALAQDEPSLSLSLALALRSASLGVPVARDLAVMGGLGLGSEVLPVTRARERALAAWSEGYRTLLVSPVQLESLVRDLPEEVRNTLRLVPVATLQAAARAAACSDPAGSTGPTARKASRARRDSARSRSAA